MVYSELTCGDIVVYISVATDILHFDGSIGNRFLGHSINNHPFDSNMYLQV